MNKNFFALAFVLVLVGSLFGIVEAAPPNRCPIKSDTNIVVYGDTGFGGVGDLSKSWIEQFMNWWESYDGSINYVFLDARDVSSYCDLSDYPNVQIYIQPGGNAYYQQKSLGADGKANINDFLDNDGGSYVGICAGAFYAAGDYYWQDSYYDWSDLLGRYPTVEGSIRQIADYDENPGYALTTMDNGFEMIYYGGPTRGLQHTSDVYPGEKLMSFNAIQGDLPSAIKHENMLLMSVHAEAYENDGISGLTTEQRVENYKWLANSINDASGTNFFVPAYAEPTQCSDGIDNDADGLVDLADPGCSSASDDDETDPVGPTQLLFDDFENGLNGWSTTSVSGGQPWTASNEDPYAGSGHAQSQPRSTDEPASIMEQAVSTEGFSEVSLSYYRKLVGLDRADEFKAMWFDGNSWNVLEQTGNGNGRDESYHFRSFDLPSNAGNNPYFKLKFECTAGAVSEYCRVDNIELTGQ